MSWDRGPSWNTSTRYSTTEPAPTANSKPIVRPAVFRRWWISSSPRLWKESIPDTRQFLILGGIRERSLRLLEYSVDQRLECRQRKSVVLGVERGLVPVIGESTGKLIPRFGGISTPRIGIEPDQRVIMASLEILVRPDDLIGLG